MMVMVVGSFVEAVIALEIELAHEPLAPQRFERAIRGRRIKGPPPCGNQVLDRHRAVLGAQKIKQLHALGGRADAGTTKKRRGICGHMLIIPAYPCFSTCK